MCNLNSYMICEFENQFVTSVESMSFFIYMIHLFFLAYHYVQDYSWTEKNISHNIFKSISIYFFPFGFSNFAQQKCTFLHGEKRIATIPMRYGKNGSSPHDNDY